MRWKTIYVTYSTHLYSTDMSNGPFFRVVQLSPSTAQTCLLHKNVIFLKMRKFSGVLLKISLIFKKFYNIMKYIIKIIFIGVSGLCKIFLTKVVVL